eukprot:TRINITY_DN626_c0_g1_i1.p1 TRINITY_DN626_c0_g1~~TRINITY_DN626_c0_g1_i1.p1  ORF type:complete len:352 (+),score=54.00 TRINITY_DN626_c0_g1_i1:1495-2550(+)
MGCRPSRLDYYSTDDEEPSGNAEDSNVESTDDITDDEARAFGRARKIRFKDLRTASANFAHANLLGKGSFGKVYLGTLPTKLMRGMLSAEQQRQQTLEVAIKKMDQGGFQGYREWLAEVLVLDQLRHPNLIRLMGYCNEEGEVLLVYQLCKMGSLETMLLRGVGKAHETLPWGLRVRIARDVTRGLAFLHSHNIIHRDLKTSNVLLADNMNALLTDFGLARAGPDGSVNHVSTRILGTKGYLDPNYLETGRLTKKSDTYSLGVIFLELITGRGPIVDPSKSPPLTLVEWMRPHLEQRRPTLSQFVDPRFEGHFNKAGVVKLTILAKHCVHDESMMRPELDAVSKNLETVDV